MRTFGLEQIYAAIKRVAADKGERIAVVGTGREISFENMSVFFLRLENALWLYNLSALMLQNKSALHLIFIQAWNTYCRL